MIKRSNLTINKLAKSTLALILTGSVIFSSSSAFADDLEGSTEEFAVVNLEALQTHVESTQPDIPALIPGDFFYFSKVILERLQLAFTFNNAKEAELLAAYSSERLSEAAALYAKGDETKALEVIHAAIEYIEQSQIIVDAEATGETADQEIDENASETEVDADTVETAEDDVVSEDDDAYGEIRDTLRQNIAALTAAKAHVGNEKAEAALQKNIDKTYAKLAKKIDKLEKKYGKHKKKQNQSVHDAEDAESNESSESSEETVEPSLNNEENLVVTLENDIDSAEGATNEWQAPVVPGKAVENGLQKGKSVEKQQAKQAKQAEKTAQKEAKQAQKEKKND